MDGSAEKIEAITFPVIKVRQPIGEFYVGTLPGRTLTAMSVVDMRRLAENDLDRFIGVQRPLSDERIKELRKYVNMPDSTFPTGVILAVSEKCAEIENTPVDGVLMLTIHSFTAVDAEEVSIPFSEVATIIDGQHRIGGLKGIAGDIVFDVNVAIFVGADLSDQASIFGTVNLAQTKVNRSLAIDLFELSKVRSPQKSCHEVIVALDRMVDSPFHHKIKRLGVATVEPDGSKRKGETISQATLVDKLMLYISDDPMEDRKAALEGRKPSPPTPEMLKQLIFRGFFVRNDDAAIADIVWNYFDAVKSKWQGAWESTGKGMVLNRTNGIRAFIRFLRPAYLNFTTTEQIVSREQFLELFSRSNLRDADFNTQEFPPGTSGEKRLYERLVADTKVRR